MHCTTGTWLKEISNSSSSSFSSSNSSCSSSNSSSSNSSSNMIMDKKIEAVNAQYDAIAIYLVILAHSAAIL